MSASSTAHRRCATKSDGTSIKKRRNGRRFILRGLVAGVDRSLSMDQATWARQDRRPWPVIECEKAARPEGFDVFHLPGYRLGPKRVALMQQWVCWPGPAPWSRCPTPTANMRHIVTSNHPGSTRGSPETARAGTPVAACHAHSEGAAAFRIDVLWHQVPRHAARPR